MITFYAVLGIVILIAISAWVSYRAKSVSRKNIEEFYVAGRNIGWIITFLTFSATLFSAFTLVGMPGFFYTHGIGSWIFIAVVDTFMALMVPLVGYRIWKAGKKFHFVTPAQFLGERYESYTTLVVVVLIEFAFLLPYMSIQAIGIAKLLESAAGIPYLVGLIIALIATYIYIETGGMRAVAWTDAILGLTLFIGAYAVSFWFLSKHFGSLSNMFHQVYSVKKELLTIPGPKGLFTTPMLISFFIMIFAMPATQFQLTTRYFIAKDVETLRKSMIGIAAFASFVLFPSLILGIGAAYVWPHLKSGDMVLGKVLSELSPALMIFGIMAVFAAALSTIDSQLLVLSALFTRDIVLEKSGEISMKKKLMINRLVVIVLSVIIFFISLNPPKLIVQLSILSFAGTLQILPAVIGALYWKRATAPAALWSMISGVAVLILLKFFHLHVKLYGWHPAIWGLVVASVVFILLSLVTKPPQERGMEIFKSISE